MNSNVRTRRTGSWYVTQASYPGLFSSYTGKLSVTFTTNSTGYGSCHLNMLAANFAAPSIYTLSVWIDNPNGLTVLISDNFQVSVS